MTKPNPSPEQFLAAFHDSNAGITSRALWDLAVSKDGQLFSSSYECLANEIPESGRVHTILDIACGDGYLLSLFAARRQSNITLVGVDISQGELDAACRRLGNIATLRQCRAQSLSLATASIDYVVCHMALMLMNEAEVVLAETHRVMRKGGVFAALVGKRPPPSAVFDAYLALLSQFPRKEEGLGGMRFGDPRLRTRDGITQLFSKSFKNIVVQDVLAQRRYTPEELCKWLENTYDFHMLDARSQKDFNSKFIVAIEGECGSDGKVEYNSSLCLIAAEK